LTLAKSRSMGAALGIIIATIITVHITNISEKSTPLQGRTLPMVIPVSALLWDTYAM
jgi:ABC-type lipoprotein release transport system permease subunit